VRIPFFKKREPKALKVRVLGATDVGLKREKNEDAYLAVGGGQSPEKPSALMIVADGMGGHADGEIASKMAVDIISRELTEAFEKDVIPEGASDGRLAQILRKANKEIYLEGSDGSGRSMGTTCTTAMVFRDRLCIAHAGDSRAYLYRNGSLSQLTTDDSWVMERVLAGSLTKLQARQHPNRNIVTQALGIHEDIDIEVLSIDLRPGDRILLCSDGLHGLIEDDELKNILAGSHLESTADSLIDRARAYGGDDNITVVLGDVSKRTP
jgi:protein phosphatase